MKKWKARALSRSSGWPEAAVLLVYVCGLLVMSRFHEPWFDESQAWLIAKSAPLRDILFKVPHYEGHPPLWHLLLAAFAKTGAPFPLSLFGVNIVISAAAMGVLLFRAPFPRAIRWLLPFTYFFFFQFGVNSRPYSMGILALLLAAASYRERNARPVRYVLSLSLLCLISLYGILLAGGLCMVWTGEILRERKGSLRRFWEDRRFLPLLGILLLAVLLCWMLVPAQDIYNDRLGETLRFKLTLGTDTLVRLPYESWLGNTLAYDLDMITPPAFVMAVIGGLLCWVLLVMFAAANRRLWTFLLPYGLFCLFYSYGYGTPHHIGMLLGFHLFYLWILAESPEGIRLPASWRRVWDALTSPVLRRGVLAAGAAVLLTPVYYNAAACIYDIGNASSPIYLAEFIRQNHLEDKKLMVAWKYQLADEGAAYAMHYIPSEYPVLEDQMPYIEGLAVTTLPYLEGNVFMNFNLEYPGDLYVHYQQPEDIRRVFALWEAQGLPDFIFGYVPLQEVYGEAAEEVHYVCIEEFHAGKIFKNNVSFTDTHRIYIREELLEEYPQFRRLYP